MVRPGSKGNVSLMTRAAEPFTPWLGVFETLRVIDGRPLFVPEHAAELQRAANALGLDPTLDLAEARAGLPLRSGRWRWVVTAQSSRAFFTEEEAVPGDPLEISVSPVRVGSNNWDARFKTVSYLAHAQARKMAATPEVVLLNEHRHIASAAGANIFWRRGERFYTPAHEAGCRCGVVRGFVLKRREVEEGHFALEDLLEADEIFLTNSMRGVVSVRALEGRALEEFTAAEALRVEYIHATQSA
jgi:branched-subunit amino acid aminotransferase/4-amino-4-deoxychorismate lyase